MRTLLLTLTVLASTLAQPPQRPPDFDFRFEYGCWRDTLDTFRAEFLRSMEAFAPPVSITLSVPPAMLDRVYQTVSAARFVEYPSTYHEPPTSEIALRFPARYYFLDVRMDGVRHAVTWSEPVAPYTPAGRRLQDMFEKLISIVEALPEVRRMPVPEWECL